VFLGTPHRGAALAALLSAVLAVLFSRKVFVNQLRSNSEMIQGMNDAFRDRSQMLQLVSFYESEEVVRGTRV